MGITHMAITIPTAITDRIRIMGTTIGLTMDTGGIGIITATTVITTNIGTRLM
jgi:hypothetical protein